MVNPKETTGSGTYIKLWLIAKLFRTFAVNGGRLGRAMGKVEPLEPPHEVVILRSTKSSRTIKLNIYRNKAALALANGPTAVHLNWHGSGWMLPLQGQNAGFIRALLQSEELADYPLTILDCSYALSPEHPCPAYAEDGRDTYDYVLANKDKYDATKMTLSGFSAGAAIALGLSVTLGAEARERAAKAGAEPTTTMVGHPIPGVIAFYPGPVTWLGDRPKVPAPPPSYKGPGRDLPEFVQDVVTAAHFFSPSLSTKLSVEEEEARKLELASRPAISPACALDEDFPPRLVMYTAEYDHLHVRAEELRERLHKSGKCRVSGRLVMGIGHGWDLEARPGGVGYEERVEAYATAVQLIKEVNASK
ncbi:hypothetical protein FRC17_004675 [Serendipita sp. 399]|nr:hypothetical protein FRC17_004675 [Serendipita sp. 399]